MKPRALFVAVDDPDSVTSWSGTPYFMLRALRTVAEVEVLILSGHPLLERGGRIPSHLVRREVDLQRTAPARRADARHIARALQHGKFDFVFSPSSMPMSALKTRVPIVYWTDSVFEDLANHYSTRFPLSDFTVRAARAQETDALRGAAAAGYSSEWAIAGSRRLVPDAHTVLAEFGPNLTDASIDRIRAQRAARPKDGPMRLLWIGADWDRKGGEVALRAASMIGTSHDVHLDLVGATPAIDSPWMTSHGRLSKSNDFELHRIEQLFGAADVFLLPSRADCTPIVISECAAVGLPVAVSDAGGLGEMVERHGIGEVVPIGPAESIGYLDAINRIHDDYSGYVAACARASHALDYPTGLHALLSAAGIVSTTERQSVAR